jgi:hypothetical protein
MRGYVRHLTTAALLAALMFGKQEISRGVNEVPGSEEPFDAQQIQAGNLLVNSSMEEGFYWKHPNHYVANGWQRWWIGGAIPEYDDVRAWRPHRYDGNHAQVYFRWGSSYTAGIYQQVAVRPCTYYQFSMYGRNHSNTEVNHHARVGIDPLGRECALYMSRLPSDIVWSPEQTFFYTWGLHTVIAESRSDHITAIAYVSPDNVYTAYDTFWDTAALVELPPPPGQLPDPPNWDASEFITGVVSYTLPGELIIRWNTAEPASAQVWYQVHTPTPPTTSTVPTGTPLFPAVYLPVVISSPTDSSTYPMYTAIDQSYLTHHEATIEDLEEGQVVKFVILARHLECGSCRTSTSAAFEVTIASPVPPPRDPFSDAEGEQ